MSGKRVDLGGGRVVEEATATVTAEDAEAELSITKAADRDGVNVGDTITYTVVVTNKGNVSVKDGSLEDDHADLSGETFALAPGEEATFAYTYNNAISSPISVFTGATLSNNLASQAAAKKSAIDTALASYYEEMRKLDN